MTRSGILVALGVGAVGVSDPSWLLPFVLVTAAVFALPWRRRKPANRVRLPATIPGQAAHYHYCAGCDEQWRHDGRDCIAHWASRCPACAAQRETAVSSARPSEVTLQKSP
jgi:hypothetical protein